MPRNDSEIDELRRALLAGGTAVMAIGVVLPLIGCTAQSPPAETTQTTPTPTPTAPRRQTVSTFTTKEGVELYYKD
ncbi:MAG TPA: hypothetical protein VIT66_12970, partial [Lysobacter sp.]